MKLSRREVGVLVIAAFGAAAFLVRNQYTERGTPKPLEGDGQSIADGYGSGRYGFGDFGD